MKKEQREALRKLRRARNIEGRKANAAARLSRAYAPAVIEPEIIYTRPVAEVVMPENPQLKVLGFLAKMMRGWGL